MCTECSALQRAQERAVKLGQQAAAGVGAVAQRKPLPPIAEAFNEAAPISGRGAHGRGGSAGLRAQRSAHSEAAQGSDETVLSSEEDGRGSGGSPAAASDFGFIEEDFGDSLPAESMPVWMLLLASR